MKTFAVMEHPVDIDGVYPDEYLDYWGAVFLANPQVRAAGVLFGSFLRYPAEILHAVAFAPLAPERVGLLTAQRRLQRRFDQAGEAEQLPLPIESAIVALEAAGARVSNGALVEKLRHHAWPRKVDRQQPMEV